MVAIHGASPSGRFELETGLLAEPVEGRAPGDVLRATDVVRDLVEAGLAVPPPLPFTDADFAAAVFLGETFDVVSFPELVRGDAVA